MPNSEIVPVTKPVVTDDEQKFRESLYPKVKTIKDRNVLCTSCNSSVKELILKGKPVVHPFMDTLLCEKCHSFFGDGEFSVDEDGSDKYCRWCGQGGTLFLCSRCNAGFCKKCIKRNLPRSALAEVDKDDWLCYCCNVKPLYELRAHCWAALEYCATKVKSKEETTAPSNRKKSRTVNSNSEEEEEEEKEPKSKKRKLSKKELDESKSSQSSKKEEETNDEEKVKRKSEEAVKAKNSQNEYKVLVRKYCDMLDDTVKVSDLLKRKCSDYKHKRVKVKQLNSVHKVEEFLVKFETLSSSAEESLRKLRIGMKDYTEKWKKALKEVEKCSSEDGDESKEEPKSLENGLSPKKSEENDEVDMSKEEDSSKVLDTTTDKDESTVMDLDTTADEGNKEKVECNEEDKKEEEESTSEETKEVVEEKESEEEKVEEKVEEKLEGNDEGASGDNPSKNEETPAKEEEPSCEPASSADEKKTSDASEADTEKAE